MVRFNPPPGWPVPPGWSPSPDWKPDPAWPPAPQGWVFWVDESSATEERAPDDASEPQRAATVTGLFRRWRFSITVVGSMAVTVALGLGALAVWSNTPRLNIRTLPHTATITQEWAITPDWPIPGSENVDFTSWKRFGGVDAQFNDRGRSVVLDTHDTTDTWRTKWSGLTQSGPRRCNLRITGRVRDISHSVSVPGGFAIGLATLGPGDPATAELIGTAIQFDFGFDGYRVARYPDDSGSELLPARLDRQWHDIEATIGTSEHTLVVDGKTILHTQDGGQCGNLVLRVWAGGAEFADFSFRAV